VDAAWSGVERSSRTDIIVQTATAGNRLPADFALHLKMLQVSH
jgi:hypothetical protein